MIEKKEVLWLANLAKLELSDSELDEMTREMEEIVGFAGQVATAAAGTEEYRGVITEAEALRGDDIGDSSTQDAVLSNVGGGENGYFPVKRRRHDAR